MNTRTMTTLHTNNMTALMTEFEQKLVSPPSSELITKEVEITKVTKLTKPAKVPTWTKDMLLETYNKQLASWTEMNEDVPEYVKYHDLIEELKKNKEIKALQRYIEDHILTMFEKKKEYSTSPYDIVQSTIA